MINSRWRTTVLWTMAYLLAGAAMSVQGCTRAADKGNQVLSVGQYGDVRLKTDTKAGDLNLKAGRYYFQHRVQGADHFIHITELREGGPPQHPVREYSSTIMMPEAKSHPGEVKCKLEPLKEKAKRTAVYIITEQGTTRITRIDVAGEDVAHLF